LGEVWIDGDPYKNFEPESLTVKLPETKERVRVKVRIVPADKRR
jgi:hypothetical protein